MFFLHQLSKYHWDDYCECYGIAFSMYYRSLWKLSDLTALFFTAAVYSSRYPSLSLNGLYYESNYLTDSCFTDLVDPQHYLVSYSISQMPTGWEFGEVECMIREVWRQCSVCRLIRPSEMSRDIFMLFMWLTPLLRSAYIIHAILHYILRQMYFTLMS